jgi:hypothetical protein
MLGHAACPWNAQLRHVGADEDCFAEHFGFKAEHVAAAAKATIRRAMLETG